jgi:hypothetical protein
MRDKVAHEGPTAERHYGLAGRIVFGGAADAVDY